MRAGLLVSLFLLCLDRRVCLIKRLNARRRFVCYLANWVLWADDARLTDCSRAVLGFILRVEMLESG